MACNSLRSPSSRDRECVCVQPWAAVIIGLISGVLYVWASKFVIYICHIDDPLDAVAVHAVCGSWGLFAASLFSAKVPTAAAYGIEEYGLFMGGGGTLLLAAFVTFLAVVAWTLGHMVPFFIALKMLGLFRVSEKEEEEGLDKAHNMGIDSMMEMSKCGSSFHPIHLGSNASRSLLKYEFQ
jgi:ammonium transporter, Amt family